MKFTLLLFMVFQLLKDNKMFEVELQNMVSTEYVGPEIYNIICGDNVGLDNCGLVEGWNELSFSKAISIIQKINKALISCPKYLKKRVESLKNQIIFGFGLDMEEYLNI